MVPVNLVSTLSDTDTLSYFHEESDGGERKIVSYMGENHIVDIVRTESACPQTLDDIRLGGQGLPGLDVVLYGDWILGRWVS